MHITVEISYYPLITEYDKAVLELLELIKTNSEISVSIGTMSTLISGEYDDVMELINHSMKQLMEKYPSVFNLKISNSCEILQ